MDSKKNIIQHFLWLMRNYVAFVNRNVFTIDRFEYGKDDSDEVKVFYHVTGKRASLSIKTVDEIMQNETLINSFSRIDAARIGQLYGRSRERKKSKWVDELSNDCKLLTPEVKKVNVPNNVYNNTGYQYLSLLSMLFVTFFLTATILSHKMFFIYGIEFPGGIFVFPFTFFLGDVITEIYGAQRCNKVIYITLICQIVFCLMSQFVLGLPASPSVFNEAYHVVLGGSLPYYCFASIIGSLLAYSINNYILLRIKLLTDGKYLWLRTIGATAVGEAVYTIIIVCIGYNDVLNGYRQLSIILAVYFFKVFYEVVSTPFTYLTVRFLRQRDKINIFEKYENIDPFTLELKSEDIV